MAKRLTKNQFVEKSNIIHPTLYNYSEVEYTNNSTKVKIICNNHGPFFMRPSDHLRGQGCKQCSFDRKSKLFKKTTKQFIAEARKVHNSFYDYSKVKYTSVHTDVIISCPVHGNFLQRPNNHLHGMGCRKCFDKQNTNLGRYSDLFFETNPEIAKKDGVLYGVILSSSNESFIKVGITIQTINDRLKTIKSHGYDIDVFLEKHIPINIAYSNEQTILQELSNQQVYPNVKFNGYTECMANTDENINTIMNIVERSK